MDVVEEYITTGLQRKQRISSRVIVNINVSLNTGWNDFCNWSDPHIRVNESLKCQRIISYLPQTIYCCFTGVPNVNVP
uniref:Uncharacterized protein n=1 Tax=Babesia bovis TaxID=5865 RepID=S6AZP3_BABBO|nr:hypothetical protein [Babesia bovis]